MPMVGVGLAHSLESFWQSLPSWRDLSLRKRKPARFNRSPTELARLIEGEIIPRLLVSHRAPVAHPADVGARSIAAAEADDFAAQALDRDAYQLLESVEVYLARGVSADSILIDLLAPAARRLGVYWEEDRCDFIDVTMGLWRLQELVHELASRMPAAAGGDRCALFSVMPGAQHSFGLLMVDEFFRTAGWSTEALTEVTEEGLLGAVHRARFDLIGVTISLEQDLERAHGLVAALRQRSRNPRVAIMVGGRLISERPELALLIGADATAPDARRAVERAEALVDSPAYAETSRG